MPDFSPNKAPEAAKESADTSKEQTKSQEQEDQLDVPGGAASGVLEGIEDVEGGADKMTAAETKEGVGEHRQATGGKFQQFQQQMTEEEAEELKKKLLEKPPTPRQMVNEIRSHVNREVHQLEKEAKKLRRKGQFHELALAVNRMRELKLLLSKLFTATADAIRNMWLKVVHGIA